MVNNKDNNDFKKWFDVEEETELLDHSEGPESLVGADPSRLKTYLYVRD